MKQAYHHKDLRNALVDEALAILAAEGAGEITLRELARRLGVTHTAPYAHFADKKSLLEAIADEGFARLSDGLSRAGSAEPDPGERFVAQGLAYIQFARENPNLYRLMFADAELSNSPDAQWCDEADRAFDQLIGSLNAIGLPEGTDVRHVAFATWAMVHGVAMLEIDRRFEGKSAHMALVAAPNGDEIVRLLSNVLLLGLRAGHTGS